MPRNLLILNPRLKCGVLINSNFNKIRQIQMSNVNLPQPCAVHLDLKGLAPTEDRLLELLRIYKAAGYNAILIEWEDMFPWTVDERFRSETCYSPEFIARFVKQANELDISLIPLVQCLGHMETVLRLPAYAHLREQPDRCDCLNPLAEGARDLIQRMIDDVLALMPGITYFHLGGDEAWSFATHPDTKAFAEQHGKDQLYMQHVEPLLDGLIDKGIRPLLWHDMMIDWDVKILSALAGKADLVVWGYVGHPDNVQHHFNTRYIERFHKLNVPMWAAGAYKGADGMSADLPDVSQRVANAQAWMELDQRFAFAGVIATAWSRYSTHRIQNEPIDGALDALVAVGHIFTGQQLPSDVQAIAILRELGEYDRWNRCHDALASLTQARQNAWEAGRAIHEAVAVVNVDAKREDFGTIQAHVDAFDKAMKQFDVAASKVSEALAGLTHQCWIDEYINTRRNALASAANHLEHTAIS